MAYGCSPFSNVCFYISLYNDTGFNQCILGISDYATVGSHRFDYDQIFCNKAREYHIGDAKAETLVTFYY